MSNDDDEICKAHIHSEMRSVDGANRHETREWLRC